MRRAEHHSRALQTAVAGVVIAAFIAAIALATFLPANEDTLRVHLATIGTSTAEGLTLTRGDDEERLTRSFYDTELELLWKDVEKASSSLASARPEPELRSRFVEAMGLASEAAAGLRTLAAPGARAESVIAGQATLGAIHARAKAMEQELEP
jgi:hypothetical protein